MRRSIARGRVFPQSFSTDRRYGRLSLKAIGLFHLMWCNADDQGRLCGDPEEIKYACCPNIDHITKQDIPVILNELVDNELILHYATSKTYAVQLLDWWGSHNNLQWAWPSDYPAPNGWQDHLRYKRDARTVEMLNWPVSGERSGESNGSSQVKDTIASGERSGETITQRFPDLPKGTETERETGRGIGKGNSPETQNGYHPSANIRSGEHPASPSPVTSPSELEILDKLKDCFEQGWGQIKAAETDKIYPRRAGGKDTAQLRDLARELSSAGGCQLDWINEAFREAAKCQKMHISYVAEILRRWLGIERIRSP